MLSEQVKWVEEVQIWWPSTGWCRYGADQRVRQWIWRWIGVLFIISNDVNSWCQHIQKRLKTFQDQQGSIDWTPGTPGSGENSISISSDTLKHKNHVKAFQSTHKHCSETFCHNTCYKPLPDNGFWVTRGMGVDMYVFDRRLAAFLLSSPQLRTLQSASLRNILPQRAYH